MGEGEMSNPLMEGWPTLTEETGDFPFVVRTLHGEGRYKTREDAEAGRDAWLEAKYESEQPRKSLADKLADALQDAFDGRSSR
jgi:hypothetical protein